MNKGLILILSLPFIAALIAFTIGLFTEPREREIEAMTKYYAYYETDTLTRVAMASDDLECIDAIGRYYNSDPSKPGIVPCYDRALQINQKVAVMNGQLSDSIVEVAFFYETTSGAKRLYEGYLHTKVIHDNPSPAASPPTSKDQLNNPLDDVLMQLSIAMLPVWFGFALNIYWRYKIYRIRKDMQAHGLLSRSNNLHTVLMLELLLWALPVFMFVQLRHRKHNGMLLRINLVWIILVGSSIWVMQLTDSI